MTAVAMAYGSGGSYFDPTTGAVKQASLYFYRAGTLDPIDVWTTSAMEIPYPIPVLTTGYGRVPPVWIAEIAAPGYRVRVFDQWSQLIEDVDNIPGPVVPESGGGGEPEPADPTRLYQTGDLAFTLNNVNPRLGWVLCNGMAIGDSQSTYADGYKNDDAEALFKYLWGQDQHERLQVYPDRGGTADGDWIAHKAIATPDFRCRTVVGMDGMGNALTNRFAGVPMDSQDVGITPTPGLPQWLAATGGEAMHTLVKTELAKHGHPITDPTHRHGMSESGHTHQLYDWGHSHGYSNTGHLSQSSYGLIKDTVATAYYEQRVGVTGSANVWSALTTAPAMTGIQMETAFVHGTIGESVTGITVDDPAEGDTGHNTVMPFLTVCVFMKL